MVETEINRRGFLGRGYHIFVEVYVKVVLWNRGSIFVMISSKDIKIYLDS